MEYAEVSTDLYTRILQFYARQMQSLDSQNFYQYSETFSEGGLFKHSPNQPAAHGREEILETLIGFHKSKFSDTPVQRRHWFNQVCVTKGEDGDIHSTLYTLVITSQKGEETRYGPSCFVTDLLREDKNGNIETFSRVVDHDGVF